MELHYSCCLWLFKYWNCESTLWECTRFGLGFVLFCFPSSAAERKYLSQTAGLAFFLQPWNIRSALSSHLVACPSGVHTCDWVWSGDEPQQMPVCQWWQLQGFCWELSYPVWRASFSIWSQLSLTPTSPSGLIDNYEESPCPVSSVRTHRLWICAFVGDKCITYKITNDLWPTARCHLPSLLRFWNCL